MDQGLNFTRIESAEEWQDALIRLVSECNIALLAGRRIIRPSDTDAQIVSIAFALEHILIQSRCNHG